MEIREFKIKDWQKVRDFWKSLNFLTPFDRKWVYERKMKEYSDLFLIAEEDGEVVGTCIANYDIQLSYIRFLIKEGYEKTGEKLLKEMEKRLRKRGTLAMFIVPHKGKPCERSLKSIKLEGLNKYANCEFWVKFLSKKEDFSG
jgi:N-acetylglutamate synthase-like GNAT family acetyltransferase